ncbi:alpha-ketoglutarate decarboxylase [Polaribacter sp.]|uniref:alpha-ketoglutarate decarboxylase n=1 Tax=Polaribacter sp. TaxID=1920175 RepID=UPI003EF19E5F
MKKYVLLTFLSFSLSVVAQQKSDFWEHVRIGGGVSASFGSQTTLGISPSAIYDFNNGFSLGAGLSYQYSKYDTFTSNVYGASIIGLYQIPVVNLQLSTELEQLYLNQKDGVNSYSSNFPALHLGVAYNQGRFAFGFRYDVLYDKNKSIYGSAFSPIVRFYF